MELRNYLHIALLTAISLVLFLVEGLIPLPFIAPGAKLGLANIVTVYALYTLGPRSCLFIILLRTGLASFFGGGPTIFLFSLAGGLLSLTVMTALRPLLHYGRQRRWRFLPSLRTAHHSRSCRRDTEHLPLPAHPWHLRPYHRPAYRLAGRQNPTTILILL